MLLSKTFDRSNLSYSNDLAFLNDSILRSIECAEVDVKQKVSMLIVRVATR